MKDLKLVVSVIASVFGIILLVVAHDPGLAAILFVIGAVLALYSLLDWLTAGKRFKCARTDQPMRSLYNEAMLRQHHSQGPPLHLSFLAQVPLVAKPYATASLASHSDDALNGRVCA